MRRLLREAAQHAPSPPDLYFLRNLPRQFESADNPLVFEKARPTASLAYGTTLPATVEELAARISKQTRKKLRKKEARLAELGAIDYEHDIGGPRREAITSALLEQKSTRFAGVGSSQRRILARLLHDLSKTQEDIALELHALSIDGRVVAVYAGVRRRGRFSAMLNSYDTDEAIARCSPGELLLHALMRNLVERGIAHFDLGTGEARYKKAVCEEEIRLYDQIVPASTRGRLLTPLFWIFLHLKRRAKRSPAFLRHYYRLKALLWP